MLTKEKLKTAIDTFPEKFSLDELLDKLVLLDKIERGDMQANEGDVMSDEELEKEMEKWFE